MFRLPHITDREEQLQELEDRAQRYSRGYDVAEDLGCQADKRGDAHESAFWFDVAGRCEGACTGAWSDYEHAGHWGTN